MMQKNATQQVPAELEAYKPSYYWAYQYPSGEILAARPHDYQGLDFFQVVAKEYEIIRSYIVQIGDYHYWQGPGQDQICSGRFVEILLNHDLVYLELLPDNHQQLLIAGVEVPLQ